MAMDEVVFIDEDDEEEDEEKAPAEGGNLPRVTSEPLSAMTVDEPAEDEPAEPAEGGEAAPAEDGAPAVPERPLEEVQGEFQQALVAFWLSRGQAPPVLGVTWWRHDSANFTWAIWLAVQRHGGYDHVTDQKLWRTCADSLQRPPPRDCTTISYQVKQAYEKGLLPFERSPNSTAAGIPASLRLKVVGRGGGGGASKPRASKPRAPGTGGTGTRHRSARNRGFASSDEASSGDDVAAGGRDAKGAMTFVAGPGDPRPARTKRAAAQRAGWTTRFDSGDFLDSYDVDVDTLWTGQRHPGDPFAEAAPNTDGHGGLDMEQLEEEERPERQQEWVLCNACRKWRRLPRGVPASSLPPKWLCEQATWRVTLPPHAMPGQTAPARLKLCCIVPEYNSSGEREAMCEEGAPEVALTDNMQWLFAFETADDARRAKGGAAAPAAAE